MIKRIYCLFLLIGFFGFLSCASDDDSDVRRGGEQADINRFVWRALNEWYYWQKEVNNLSDNLLNTSRYNDLINHNTPEDLFKHLLSPKDGDGRHPYSVIKSDYTELEDLFNGVLNSEGFQYGILPSGDALLVLYVTKGSDSKAQGLKRGDIITKINGTPINQDNFQSLLSQSTLTLELSESVIIGLNRRLTPIKTITVHTSQKQENPIVFDTVFTSGTKKIGYLFYTDFFREYNDELNEVFGKFKSKGVNELILDLRYNGGGNVQTSTYLASMITGQFKDKIYSELRSNSKKHQSTNFKLGDKMNIYERENDVPVITEDINHLNLKRLVVIGTGHTASASELIINGLRGLDGFTVTLVGEKTEGKDVASITLYDSNDFTKENINPYHRYAMQPIVSKSYNAKGESDYSNGFSPDINAKDLSEGLFNIFPLGDLEEPMLKIALKHIEPSVYNAKRSNKISIKDKIPLKGLLFSKDLNPFNKDMVIRINP